jgi:hypothetical protein
MPREMYIYIGQWRNNQIDGRGFELTANRSCWYEGQFVQGKK